MVVRGGGSVGRSARRRAREQDARLERLRSRNGLLYGEAALEAESLSLRHMAANGLTPDGNLERLSLEAEMANTPGWRGRRALKATLMLSLVVFVVLAIPFLWWLGSLVVGLLR